MELFIRNKDTLYFPVVEEGIEWTTERSGSAGKLTFKCIDDGSLNITEGNHVRFKWDDANIFYGYVFSKKTSSDKIMTITAYDQLRYLKNKDTYVYENKTATEFIQMLAADFNLQCGTLEDTKYKIASRTEDNKTLFDMIQSALELTLTNTKNMFVMYDDFGKITLKSLGSMQVGVLIDSQTIQDFDYTSSIDENTYNQIKLSYENKTTGKRDIYMTKSGENINEWGVLQYYDKLQSGENGQAKADALLSLYNVKTRKLSIKDAIGDVRVRAGSLLPVQLNLGDITINNLMLVESCKHTFNDCEHWMDLTVRGGEFVV